LAGLNTNKPGGPSEEERLTFEDLAADYIKEREVRGATGACLQWSKSRVANLKNMFEGVRAVEITTHRMRVRPQTPGRGTQPPGPSTVTLEP
jgi:hypothetical protein